MRIFLILVLLHQLVFALSFTQKDKLEATLHPKLQKKNFYNVMQGVAYFDNNWVTTQALHDKELIFNVFDKKGKSLFSKKIAIASHGQDLSLEKKHGKIYLYSTGNKWQGISKYLLQYSKRTGYSLKFIENLALDIGKNTPTISDTGHYFVTCANKSIYIFRSEDPSAKIARKYIYSFVLAAKQREKRQWKQGIAVKDGYIYVLTGANKIGDKKYLYIYDFYGKPIKHYELKTGKKFAQKQKGKWELEGLTFKNKSLYTTVMSGKDGHNIHQLYKILDIK